MLAERIVGVGCREVLRMGIGKRRGRWVCHLEVIVRVAADNLFWLLEEIAGAVGRTSESFRKLI